MDQYYYESGYIDSGYYAYIADGIIDQPVAASVDVVLGIVKEFTVTIDPAFTSSFAVNILVNQVAILDSTFSQTCVVEVTRDLAFALESTVSQQIDTGVIRQGNIEITSAFSPSFSVNITAEEVITLTSNSSFALTISKISGNSALLEFFATLDAIPSKTSPNEINLTLAAGLIVDTGIIKQGSADLLAFASNLTLAIKITDSIILNAGTFTQSVVEERIRDNNFALSTTSTCELIPARTYQGGSQQDSTITLSVTTEDSVTRDITANLDSTSTLTIDLEIVKQGQVDLTAFAVDVSITTRLAGLFIDDQVIATMVIDADAILSGESIQASTSQLSLIETRVFELTANFVTTTTCDINPVKTTDSIIITSSQFTEVCNSVKTVNPLIEFSAFGNSSLTISLTKQGDIELDSTASMSITISKFSDVIVPIVVSSQITAITSKKVSVQVSLSSQVSIIASGRLIFIEDYVYIVPKETRLWSIARETRSQYIDRETREYIIGD